MIYILDAYNVIHKIPQFEEALDLSLKNARDQLVEMCQKLTSSRGDITQIILVFDGKSQFRDLPNVQTSKLKIIFSETGETADNRICDVLDSLPENKGRFVVSDDNSVYNNARSHKATPMKVSDFQKLFNKRGGGNPSQKKVSNEKNISPEIADEINEEYRRKLGL